MTDKPIVTAGHIQSAAREAGLRSGDVVLVHSSLSSMGWVEGGAEAVIEALLGVLDPARGTLVFPTLCQADKERRFETWDIERSPSDVGRITEVARLRADAIRSDHPTHSVAAIGARARELTRDHAGAHGRPSPWGPAAFGHGSPWEKLYEWDAHYLFLGTTMSCNTIGHFAQAEFIRRTLEACGPRRAKFEAQLAGWNHPGVWPQFGFAIVEEWLREKDAVRYATVGEA
ncbi:MAG: AAC(3) family N-acetyltransferase, partial [Armatimonadetes bacterium]|nr:AAC(3) family N-acetyltransferase [Armatimonadota bacterium]